MWTAVHVRIDVNRNKCDIIKCQETTARTKALKLRGVRTNVYEEVDYLRSRARSICNNGAVYDPVS
jgi:hypothetical protein